MKENQTTNDFDIRTLDFSLSNLETRSDPSTKKKTITGYGALYNVPSQPMPYIEHFTPGAFDHADMSDALLLYAHDFNKILARVDSGSLSIQLDNKGLRFTATLADTTLADDVYNDILAGNLKGCSIGFHIAPGGDSYSQDENGNTIHTVNSVDIVREISITAVPAYTETSVTVQRSLEKFLKGDSNEMNNNSENSTATSSATSTATSSATSSTTSSATSSVASSAIDLAALAQQIVKALSAAAGSVATSATPASNEPIAKRDDEDVDDSAGAGDDGGDDGGDADTDSDDTEEDADPIVSTASSAASSATPTASSAQSSTSSSTSTTSSVASSAVSNTATVGHETEIANAKKKGEKIEMRDLSKTNQTQHDNFLNYLKSKTVTRDLVPDFANGGNLQSGQVLIPHDILTAQQEQYQFDRLSNLIKTISVKHTTGLYPVFPFDDKNVLTKHTEFTETPATALPTPMKITWNLSTYTGRVLLSQDLLSDSDYDWEGNMSTNLQNWRDNKNDQLSVNALTAGITPDAFKTDDPIAQLKTILDSFFKPNDGAAATMVLSQSAYAAYDALEDKEGRPLIQPDVTKGTGKVILGHTVVVVPDSLFPNANTGDINVAISPLQKSVINFHNRDITGKLQDTSDVWYTQLGIYMREDVVQARPDLIKWISNTTGAKKAAAELDVNKPTKP